MLDYEVSLSSLALSEVLPYSLYGTPVATISRKDRIWTASVMLRFFLESMTDQLVVLDNKKPCGLVGGYDIISNILKNPNFDFFENNTVDKIMYGGIATVGSKTKVMDLINEWHQSRRAFSIIQKNSQYFAVSVRTMLEIYPFMKTSLKIKDIPKKKTVYFEKDQSVKEILNLMLENKTRKLVLKDSQQYVSDRLVIETICADLNYLRDTDDFLNMSCSVFRLEKIKTVSDDIGIQQLCELFYSMDHPYVMFRDQVFSPFDIALLLKRNDIHAKKLNDVIRT